MFETPTIEKKEKNIKLPEYKRKSDKEAERLMEKIDIETTVEKMETSIFSGGWMTKRGQVIKELGRLVVELRERVDRYNTIISDEASGRLVSLIFEKMVNKRREEKEREKAKLYFLALYSREDAEKLGVVEKIDKFIKQKKNELGRVLVVSELAQTGEHLIEFLDILKKNEVDYDAAIVSIAEAKTLKILSQYNVIYGGKSKAGLSFYSQNEYLGVTKDYLTDSIHPRRIDHGIFLGQMNLGKARHDVKILADEFSKLLP